jgi:hypothetical protein
MGRMTSYGKKMFQTTNQITNQPSVINWLYLHVWWLQPLCMMVKSPFSMAHPSVKCSVLRLSSASRTVPRTVWPLSSICLTWVVLNHPNITIMDYEWVVTLIPKWIQMVGLLLGLPHCSTLYYSNLSLFWGWPPNSWSGFNLGVEWGWIFKCLSGWWLSHPSEKY